MRSSMWWVLARLLHDRYSGRSSDELGLIGLHTGGVTTKVKGVVVEEPRT